MSFSILVIIPEYGNRGLTVDCVFTITEKVRIVVADDAFPYDQQGLDDRCELLSYHQNLGFSGNVNRAVRDAWDGEDVIVILNNDTYLESKKFFIPMAELAVQSKQIVGPSIRLPNERISKHPQLLPEHTKKGLYKIKSLSGCCMVIQSSLWFDLGGLHEQQFPSYFSDTDLCFRAGKCVIDFSCHLYHSPNSTYRKVNIKPMKKAFEDKWGVKFDVTGEYQCNLNY